VHKNEFEQLHATGKYTLRRATNEDGSRVWVLISQVLASYGIVTNAQTTEPDLTDLEGNFWALGGAFFVLLAGDTMIGTVALRRESPQACELGRMYLAAEHRGQGLGRRLFDHALSEARIRGFREMHLKTASVLKEAMALYERAGFRLVPGQKAVGNCDRVMRMNQP
jgi:putative acetyltransferase